MKILTLPINENIYSNKGNIRMANFKPNHIIICEQAKIGMEDEIKLGEELGNEGTFNYHKSELKCILPFVDQSTYSKYIKYLDISFK
jgi:hypothetical protein